MTEAKNDPARAARKATHSKLLTAADVPPTLRARIAKLAATYGPDECWIWPGKITRKGYGQWCDERDGANQWFLVHRASFAIAHGLALGGLIIRHSCDTPPCCNPAHLIEGTWADNNADMVERDRTHWSGNSPELRVAKTPQFRPEVHPNNKRVIGPDGSEWLSAALAARAAGMARQTISSKCRRHIDGWRYA